MSQSTDYIERHIVLKAPRSRVWRALSDAEEFGGWFGLALAGKSLAAGTIIEGQCTYPGFEHVTVQLLIERVEPQVLLSWRWHPFAIDLADYSREPTTLVTFELKDVPEGTLLTVVESGFDDLPPERRLAAFRANANGWSEQMRSIETHVAQN